MYISCFEVWLLCSFNSVSLSVASLQWLPWSALTRCDNNIQLELPISMLAHIFFWLSGGSLSQCYVTSVFSASSASRKIANTQPQTMFGKSLSCMPEMRYKVFALKISDAFWFLHCHFPVVKVLFNIKKNWSHGIEQMQPWCTLFLFYLRKLWKTCSVSP